jgi:hypothetical protein
MNTRPKNFLLLAMLIGTSTSLVFASSAYGQCTKQEIATYLQQGMKSPEIKILCDAPSTDGCCCSVRIEEREAETTSTNTRSGSAAVQNKNNAWHVVSEDFVWMPQDQCGLTNNIDWYSRESKKCVGKNYCGH